MHTAVALTLLWIGHFLVDFMIGIWSVYKTMIGMDLAVAGILAAICSFAGEGSQMFFGNLCDRGWRKILIAGGVFLTAASILLSFTDNYYLLFVLLLSTCIGSGAFHPSAVAFVSSLTQVQKGLFISIFASGGSLGIAVSQLVFSKTYLSMDGNTLILLIPSIALLVIFALLGYCKKEEIANTTVKAPFGMKFFRDYFRNRSLRMLYLSQVCHQTIMWGTVFLLPDVLMARGYDEDIALGGGHMAFIIGSVFTMIPSGLLADRTSSKGVMLGCGVVAMVLYFSFLLVPTLSPVLLIVTLLFTGAVLGPIQPLAVALGNQIGKENPGMVSAFTMGLVWCVSETVGPAGSGLISKLFVEDAAAKSLMIFGMLFPVMLYAMLQLPYISREPSRQLQPAAALAIAEAEEVE